MGLFYYKLAYLFIKYKELINTGPSSISGIIALYAAGAPVKFSRLDLLGLKPEVRYEFGFRRILLFTEQAYLPDKPLC
jgi:hypothetical protein